MSNNNQHVVGSILLIGLGIFFFLNDFNLFGSLGDLFIGGAFGLTALLGYGLYFSRPQRWWVLFPSAVFLGIGQAILATVFGVGQIAGALFLFSLSTAFWLIFSMQPHKWWAGIPAGVLTTLACAATVTEYVGAGAASGITLIGLSLTFGMLWLLRESQPTGWAKKPALILLILALFTPMAGGLFFIAKPLLLIGLGFWLLSRRGWIGCCGGSKSHISDDLNKKHDVYYAHKEADMQPMTKENVI